MTFLAFRSALTRRAVLSSGAALAVLALSGCGPAAVSGTTLRIGYQKSGALVTAKRRGTLAAAVKAAGIETVEWIEFQYGPPLVEALTAGSLDIGGVGDAPPIFAQSGGANFVYVAAARTSGASGGVLVPGTSTVSSVAELKSKRLCFTRGTSANVTAIRALKSGGLSLGDVEYINLNPVDSAAAFAQGSIDAWVIWDPYFTTALLQQKARVLVPGETLGGRPSLCWLPGPMPNSKAIASGRRSMR
ncbi:hypothetical protein sos41_40970 [Alphaproteobacteria bacterium SO-S41]|nr:hypothetical protein sos41_40970 [Alphaproteobacteria bacterium SO-S41]